jgi:hypothetical protein
MVKLNPMELPAHFYKVVIRMPYNTLNWWLYL